MSAIEFTAQAGKTFSVQLYTVAGALLGSAIANVTDTATPTLYRADVGTRTGIVYVVATTTNLRVAGYANLDVPGFTGFSALIDPVELEVKAKTDLIGATQIVAPASAPPPAGSVGLCTVRFLVLDAGEPVVGARVTAELDDANNMVNTALVARTKHAGITDAGGIADLVMIQHASFTRGGVYRIQVSDSSGRRSHDRRVTVPSVSSCFAEDLPDA